MRKLIIAFLAISLIAGCNNNKKDPRDDRRTDREKDDYRNKDEKTTDYSDDRKEIKDDDDNRKKGWSPGEISAFVDNCVRKAREGGADNKLATDYCECMQRKIEDMYPNPLDAAGINAETPEMQKLMEQCIPTR